MKKPLVYLASPYRGNQKQNETFARMALYYAIQSGTVPIAPHLLYPQVLDDSLAGERALGIALDLALLNRCDALWLCGDEISAGMEMELEEARKVGIPCRRIPVEEILSAAQTEMFRQRRFGGEDVIEQML